MDDVYLAEIEAMLEESLKESHEEGKEIDNDTWYGDPPPTQAELN
jgi:hypothetical protein